MRRWGLQLAIILLLGAAPSAALARRWTLVTVPPVPGQSAGSFRAVSCAAPSDCIAVGNYAYHHRIYRSLAGRFKGKKFSFQSPPTRRSSPGFTAVSCATTLTCTGVGGFSAAWSQHLRHGSWQMQRVAQVRGRLRSLRAVSCAGRQMCMAVGLVAYKGDHSSPYAELWNGHRWTSELLPMPRGVLDGELNAVSCPNASACFAVGNINLGSNGRVLVDRWNGTSWSLVHAPSLSRNEIEFNGISCTSPTWCEGAGAFERGVFGATFGLIEHWDGETWKVEHVPNLSGPALNAVSCAARGSCAVVGLNSQGDTVAEHLSRGKWSVKSTPKLPSGGVLNGVSCAHDGTCLAVGYQTKGPDPLGPVSPLAERFS